jgi:uncharacterized protein YukE
MGFTKPAYPVNNVQQLPDLVKDQSTTIKQTFDKTGADTKVYIESLLSELESTTDGTSGADNIGATSITDLDGTTVQELLESIRNKLKSTTDSTSGADFINATSITDLSGVTVQDLLEALKQYIDTHKSSSDHDGRYYAKVEADNKFASKEEVNNITLGQIVDGSLTDDKLSNDAGQIKQKVGDLVGFTQDNITKEVNAVRNDFNTTKSNLANSINQVQQKSKTNLSNLTTEQYVLFNM